MLRYSKQDLERALCGDESYSPDLRADILAQEYKNLQERIFDAISYWLKPAEDGTIRGYGGVHPSIEDPSIDVWKMDSWSSAHDYQIAALSIWETLNRKNEELK